MIKLYWRRPIEWPWFIFLGTTRILSGLTTLLTLGCISFTIDTWANSKFLQSDKMMDYYSSTTEPFEDHSGTALLIFLIVLLCMGIAAYFIGCPPPTI